jgi:hypothetical protein
MPKIHQTSPSSNEKGARHKQIRKHESKTKQQKKKINPKQNVQG